MTERVKINFSDEASDWVKSISYNLDQETKDKIVNKVLGYFSDHEAYAGDEESAATQYAEESDSDGDYNIMRHGSTIIWVKDSANTVTKWFVEAESVPQYYAHPEKS